MGWKGILDSANEARKAAKAARKSEVKLSARLEERQTLGARREEAHYEQIAAEDRAAADLAEQQRLAQAAAQREIDTARAVEGVRTEAHGNRVQATAGAKRDLASHQDMLAGNEAARREAATQNDAIRTNGLAEAAHRRQLESQAQTAQERLDSDAMTRGGIVERHLPDGTREVYRGESALARSKADAAAGKPNGTAPDASGGGGNPPGPDGAKPGATGGTGKKAWYQSLWGGVKGVFGAGKKPIVLGSLGLAAYALVIPDNWKSVVDSAFTSTGNAASKLIGEPFKNWYGSITGSTQQQETERQQGAELAQHGPGSLGKETSGAHLSVLGDDFRTMAKQQIRASDKQASCIGDAINSSIASALDTGGFTQDPAQFSRFASAFKNTAVTSVSQCDLTADQLAAVNRGIDRVVPQLKELAPSK